MKTYFLLPWFLIFGLAGCQTRIPLAQVPLPPNKPAQLPPSDTKDLPAPYHQPEASHFIVEIIAINRDQAFASRLQNRWQETIFPNVFYLDEKNKVQSTEAKDATIPTAATIRCRFYPGSQEHAVVQDAAARPLRKIEVRLLSAPKSVRPNASFSFFTPSASGWKTLGSPIPAEYSSANIPSAFQTGKVSFPEAQWIDQLQAKLLEITLHRNLPSDNAETPDPITKSKGS